MKKLILILCSSAVACSVTAQNNPAVNQSTTVQQQRQTDQALHALVQGDTVPSLYAEEDTDVGPQSVLRKKKPTWFRVSADAQLFYTDNMNFQDRSQDKWDAGVAVTSLEAALTTPSCITRCASYRGEVGYRHQFFNYIGGDGREDFDFDSSTAFADMVAQTKHYQFRAGFDYTRLLGFEPLRKDDYFDFYTEYVPRWSVQRNFRVCDRSLVSLAYLGSYHFTDEEAPVIFSNTPIDPVLVDRAFPSDRSERWEHTLLAAYSVALPRHFVAQPYYRFQYTEFVNGDECLRLHTVGLGVGWIPCESFAVRGFVGYNWQDSSSGAGEYAKLDAGGGINVTLRF
jgi:hypothetical protein